MKTLFKYAIVLALGLVLGFYVHGLLSLEDVAKLKWLDEINVIINKPVVAARPAVVPSVDLAAAALLDEDLDYRIAQRIGSLDGWRSFLTAHGSGVHAQSARVEVAALRPDEICKRDGDRLERLRSSPTGDEAARFANELGCERLRPQLVDLMGELGLRGPHAARRGGFEWRAGECERRD